jgi:hypothetical protein
MNPRPERALHLVGEAGIVRRLLPEREVLHLSLEVARDELPYVMGLVRQSYERRMADEGS